MADVVKRRGQRFADALGVVAVSPPACDAGEQARAQQSLRVDDEVVGTFAQCACERAHLAPGLGLPQPATPPAHRHRNGGIDPRMQPDKRYVAFLHQPVDACLGAVAAEVGDRRQVVDHVAERGGLDDQDPGNRHAAGFVAGDHLAAATACKAFGRPAQICDCRNGIFMGLRLKHTRCSGCWPSVGSGHFHAREGLHSARGLWLHHAARLLS